MAAVWAEAGWAGCSFFSPGGSGTMMRTAWGDDLYFDGSLADNLAIALHRQRVIGCDEDALLDFEGAQASAATWLVPEHVPAKNEVVEQGVGIDDAEVELAVVRMDVGAEAKEGHADDAAIGYLHLRGAGAEALAIGNDAEAARLVAEEPGNACPDVGEETKATLVLAFGVTHHDGIQPDANMQEEVFGVYLHAVNLGGLVLIYYETAGAVQVGGDAKFLCQDVGCAEWDDTKRDVCANQTRGHIRRGAITARSDKGAKATPYGFAGDLLYGFLPRRFIEFI